ncbi:nucleotidyltransferase family protein [bacterium]|nr:nucleotidyltransferase family protein [bacterium]
MALTAEYVLGELEKHVETLRGFGVKRIGIFGSVARGEAEEGSDLDFVVDMEEWTSRAFFGTLFFLEDHFGLEVDLVPLDTIRPWLKERILGHAIYVQGL